MRPVSNRRGCTPRARGLVAHKEVKSGLLGGQRRVLAVLASFGEQDVSGLVGAAVCRPPIDPIFEVSRAQPLMMVGDAD